eukprot:7980239-Alexandrium_andersonii.AAC.1
MCIRDSLKHVVHVRLRRSSELKNEQFKTWGVVFKQPRIFRASCSSNCRNANWLSAFEAGTARAQERPQ